MAAPKKSLYRKVLKTLSSLKLAVVVILSIACITAVGTIVEARFDSMAASKLVYRTPWMYTIMAILVINLTAVMLDRWPWKRRHASFVCAHIGIIVLLFGAVLTMETGLDGTMRIGIGESTNLVQVPNTDILVYSSFDGDRYTKTYEKEVDFFKDPPTAAHPFVIPAYNDEIKIIDYVKYALPSRTVVPAEPGRAGAGLRFQVQNANVNVVEWLVQRNLNAPAVHDFGPAQIHLGPLPAKGLGKNEIYLEPGKDSLKYAVFHKESEKAFKTGIIKEGEMFEPGWMGIQFRVLRYLPSALEDWDLQVVEKPTPLTSSAVKVVFQNREHWVLLNDLVKLFTGNSVYLVSYGNRRIDIGFPVKLDHFEVDRYQGTTRAMAYKSTVSVPELGIREISMNEPMKYKGLTFYQASFQEEKGEPTATVLSVNQDPGRFFKYLGSLIIVIGIILLFYFKHLDFRKAQKRDPESRP